MAIRGGMKAARNSAIGCAILLAVIEGVGIGIQRMMAENTRLDVSGALLTCYTVLSPSPYRVLMVVLSFRCQRLRLHLLRHRKVLNRQC